MDLPGPMTSGGPARSRVPRAMGRARVALAHDFLVGVRGGERVLERLAALVTREFDAAGVYSMFDAGGATLPAIDVLERSAGMPAWTCPARRWLFPLYPAIVRGLSRRVARAHARHRIDAIVSTSSAAVKGLRAPAGVPHLCYLFAPARYAWTRTEDYARGGGLKSALRGAGLRLAAPGFRAWDRATARHVARFVTLSRYVAGQIARFYGRGASVVYPPVRTGYFTPDGGVPRGDYWLYAGALEPYKRVDLAIAAAGVAGATLVVAGEGSEGRRLRGMAGPKVRFEGRVTDDRLRGLYRGARLLVFPQVEDFGIVAAEALACGTPVVARRAGAAPEIVTDPGTGAFFDEATPRALAEACARCPPPDAARCAASAARFAEDRFDGAMRAEILAVIERGV